MLYPNGQRVFGYPGRHMSGSLAASGAMAYGGLRGARFNHFVSDTYSQVLGAVPSGYGANAATFAVKRGGLTAFGNLSISTAATGGLGMPGDGTASITFTVADADGQLISSGAGTAAMTWTVADALLTASLNGAGSAAFEITTNNALLGALADGIGSASMTFTVANAQAYPLNDTSPLREGAAAITFSGALTPYAIGSMSGSTVDNSTMTTASLLAAMNASPPAVNIKLVNDVVVQGTGASGNEWRPS